MERIVFTFLHTSSESDGIFLDGSKFDDIFINLMI